MSIPNLLGKKYGRFFSIMLSNVDWARVRRGELKGRRQKGFIHSTKKVANI